MFDKQYRSPIGTSMLCPQCREPLEWLGDRFSDVCSRYNCDWHPAKGTQPLAVAMPIATPDPLTIQPQGERIDNPAMQWLIDYSRTISDTDVILMWHRAEPIIRDLLAERDALEQQIEQMKGFVQPLSDDWNKPDMDVYDDTYKE